MIAPVLITPGDPGEEDPNEYVIKLHRVGLVVEHLITQKLIGK